MVIRNYLDFLGRFDVKSQSNIPHVLPAEGIDQTIEEMVGPQKVIEGCVMAIVGVVVTRGGTVLRRHAWRPMLLRKRLATQECEGPGIVRQVVEASVLADRFELVVPAMQRSLGRF